MRVGHIQGVAMVNLKSPRLVGWALIAVAAHYLWIFFPIAGVVLHSRILGTGWGLEGFDAWSAFNLLGTGTIPGGLLLGAGVFVLKRVETIDRRIGIRAILAVIAAFSIAYAAEMLLIAPLDTYGPDGGAPQFVDRTFAEKVEKSHLVVIGVVTDVGIKVFPEDIMDVDEHGNEYVFEHNEIPKAEVTLQILEMLKDDLDWSSDEVTFYDYVNVPIDRTDLQVTRLVSQYTTDYQKGDKGLFLINDDMGLNMLGYASFYPIYEGEETITSELDKFGGKEPLDLSEAKEIARNEG